jgi:bifunctional NMN adenylyltransferase/nudix hydrolase
MSNITAPNYGVLIGRFQIPELHEGHIALLDAVGNLHPRVIIFVGCLPGGTAPTKNDPLDFETRRKMIQNAYPNYEVYPIHNRKTDELWSADLDRLITERVPYGKATLYGSRDSFLKSYHGHRKVVELTLPVSPNISAADLRNAATNVVIDSPSFRAGIIYATRNTFDRVIPTVDIAIIHRGLSTHDPNTDTYLSSGIELLLAKRSDENGWRFPGGHAMGKMKPENVGYEDDAKMESYEETSTAPQSFKYIGSTQIADWRYKDTSETIKTIFFLGEVPTLETTGGDDISYTKFFPLEEVTLDMFEPEHKILYKMLKNYLYSNRNINNKSIIDSYPDEGSIIMEMNDRAAELTDYSSELRYPRR